MRLGSLLHSLVLCAASAADAAPLPEAGDAALVSAEFRAAAARSRGPRSGDIYTLPRPYNYVVDPPYAAPERSTLADDGRPISHRGSNHGTAWLYDTRIPLVFYGPGRVRAGARLTAPATQQDVPVTLAHLLGVPPPRDARGRPLLEALLPQSQPPRAILTLVIDQGGRSLLDAHPGTYPHIAALIRKGADFLNARVTHLEAETALGHAALGTGAYPDRTGITANSFYHGGRGGATYAYDVEAPHAPQFLESPTLGDLWLQRSGGRALLISQCYSDRAAIGMAGHGSYYRGNPAPIVIFYDERTGRLATNPAYYRLPAYLDDLRGEHYGAALAGAGGRWMGHDVRGPAAVRLTPAFARLDGDAFLRVLEREPVGQDEVTDLLYLTFKSTDAAGHRYGYESAETRAVLAEVDRQVGRVVEALERRVGRGRYLVVLTADHGGTPLPERSGGARLLDEDLLRDVNLRFDSTGRLQVALQATSAQIWTDPQAMAALGVTVDDLVTYLRGYRVLGRPFYQLVLPASDIDAERAATIREEALRRRAARSAR